MSVSKSEDAQKSLPSRAIVTAYLGHIINPISPHSYDDYVQGALLIAEDGTICGVGSWNQLKQTEFKVHKVVDYGNLLLMPGFVDSHLHLPQVSQVGKAGHGLLEWLEHNIFPAEACFGDAQYAQRVTDWFFRELIRNGTTLAAVFTTIHANATDIAFRAARDCGIRVVMGKVMMDTNSPVNLTEDLSASLTQSEELCRQWHGLDSGRLSYAFTPRFAITSTADLLHETGKLWKKYSTAYVHTHLAENKEEIKQVGQLFPEARSYLDVYDRSGLVGQGSIFAHAVYIDDNDVSVLAKKCGAIAHCPSSNFFLKSGIFPYNQLASSGLKIGLGSDIAAGPQMSLFGVMKDAAYMQKELWLTPAELLFRATMGGAQALCQDHKLGNFVIGKEADFIVVDPTCKSNVVKNILNKPTEEILSSLIYLGDDRFINATFVRGKLIYSKQKYSHDS